VRAKVRAKGENKGESRRGSRDEMALSIVAFQGESRIDELDDNDRFSTLIHRLKNHKRGEQRHPWHLDRGECRNKKGRGECRKESRGECRNMGREMSREMSRAMSR
jgi:hypothetical protein